MSEVVRVYIGLGSNLDQPEEQVKQALTELVSLAQNNSLKASSMYCSAPLGDMDQPDYINAVAAFETHLSPHELLDKLQAIEASHGRQRTGVRWEARQLDLDLLLYGDQMIVDHRLTVPHPGLTERNFVLLPLEELDPNLMLPDNSPLSHWTDQCSKQGIRRID